MPYCIIEGCQYRKGKSSPEETVVFHCFPKCIENIRLWLHYTGQQFTDLEAVAQKILEGKNTDVFRLCSAHFGPDCYKTTPKGRKLLKDSMPTLFPISENKILINVEQVLSFRRRRRKRLLTKEGEVEELPTFCKHCKCTQHNRKAITTKDCSTQTDCATIVSASQTKDFDISDLQNISLFSNTSLMQHVEHPYYAQHSTLLNSIPEKATGSQLLPKTIQSISTPLHKRRRTDTVEESIGPKTPYGAAGMLHVTQVELDTALESNFNVDPPDLIPNVTKMRKFIVFESCLDELISKVKCQESSTCQKKIERINKQIEGSAVIVRGVCEDGHRFKIFQSQPKIKRHYSGNILLAAGINCADISVSKMFHFFKMLGLVGISERSFHAYQKQFCAPAIHLAWEREKIKHLQQVRGKPIAIAGAGQCDSPGQSAKYCLYTFMDIVTRKVLDFEIIQSPQGSSSVAMEELGFDMCMSRAIDQGLDIMLFASDRHVGVRKIMYEKYGHLVHQFDARHYAKSIAKKIRQASKRKTTRSLKPWIGRLLNHFWWSVRHCENNEEKLKKLWLSFLHHVRNEHEWVENGNVVKCEHDPIEDTVENQGIWLHENTPAYNRLYEIVTHHQLLTDFKNLVWSCRTGPLKVFQSNVLKHQTKQIDFSMDSMESRAQLSALSNNHNVGRKLAAVKRKQENNATLGSKRLKLTAPKGKKKWILRNVYDAEKFSFIGPILEDTLKICQGTLLTSSRTSSFPPNIASEPRPDLEEMIMLRHSRFGSNA
ncbi:uncharacterized protein [Hyperolius riggenbachi]|uniref:uncharacterized protein n=1 Tax=Hyperolius riggenbachi TaxID=752182 RepID=UPI0035A2645F